MAKQFLRFNGDKTEKKKFHSSKNPIATDDVDTNKIIISDASACSKKESKKLMLSFSSDTGLMKKLDH